MDGSALADILNEAKGFAHLRRIGCTNVRFIPHAADKTPDLEGILNGGIVLCEVKTINISKEEAQRRQRVHQGEIVSTDISVRLSDGLLQKFTSTLNDAVGQLGSYDSQGQARRIVFAVIHFDDWVGNCQPEYFAQIDRHLQADPVVGAERWSVRPATCSVAGLQCGQQAWLNSETNLTDELSGWVTQPRMRPRLAWLSPTARRSAPETAARIPRT